MTPTPTAPTYDHARDAYAVLIFDCSTGHRIYDVVTYDATTNVYVQYLTADGAYLYDRHGNRRTRRVHGRLVVFRVEEPDGTVT